ncbi:MAG: demethylmenaquinone methyltransferase [Sciscionella sp.]
MSRASLDKDPHDVAAMFDGVAAHYDRTNSVLAFGLDRHWREVTRKVVGAGPGDTVLDLAAGTAVSTAAFAGAGAFCVAADFSLGMLHGGAHRAVPKVAADAMRLPFADNAFDVVTVSFGLRNFGDTVAALTEMGRVVRPGGSLVICEFSTPTNRAFRKLYLGYLMRALPVVARKVASNPEAYVYLAESIRAWPHQRGLAELIEQAGWTDIAWRNITNGIVAVHRAARP